MAKIISSFTIASYRGIHNLTVDQLNDINLIVGDNNCGKTSVLEALLLLRAPSDFINLIRLARVRVGSGLYTADYENFINMISKTDEDKGFGIHAVANGKTFQCVVQGEESRILLDPKDLSQQSGRTGMPEVKNVDENGSTEAMAFNGVIKYDIGEGVHEEKLSLNEYSRFGGMQVGIHDQLKIQYLAPFDHILGNIINRIIRNEKYKELCIHVLKIFDPDIEDILILRNEHTGRPVEYIRHKITGNMPISTYGDGIKKVLSLANAIAGASGGILLIDEVETAIHSKYYNKIFSFLVMACQQFGVQLFITTHSIEAVDGLLATQNYSEQESEDHINVITLKKEPARTYSRIMSGRQVANDREAFGFEVRL